MVAMLGFVWVAVISSVIVLVGYTIWNFIVVFFDLKRLGREVRREVKGGNRDSK
jgi:phosphotransferase system  glucose/maltose/N-acetylglucosamine-specific IIC component